MNGRKNTGSANKLFMSEVFVVSDNIISPLGYSTRENFSRIKNNESGIKKHAGGKMAAEDFFAALFPDSVDQLLNDSRYTRFEKILIASISAALKDSDIDIRGERTVLILSSTKGNISLIENESGSDTIDERVSLYRSGALITEYFGLHNKPLIISNACISGVMGILVAKRLINSGSYDHAVVAGADTITQFILSGFQSFQAISSEPCRPFDAERKGITLGEAAGTLILTGNKQIRNQGIAIRGGSVSNDANHISGPSRTGEPLYYAVRKALQESGLAAADIDFISAHGTATLYNDEMEAKAIALAGMEAVPVNSLKGYYGHTLGAAGLIETIVSIHSLKENTVIPTRGFVNPGVSKPITVCNELMETELNNCLKTASGFGGCNAALVISKV
jgi:3-oxoacyl-[acyl-carrier-protein] synthase-1